MKNLIYMLLGSLLFASCERDADIKVDEIDPMLAVFAIIGDGEELKVEVQTVHSIFSDTPDPQSTPNAIVKVFSDLAEETFVPDPLIPGRYISNLPNGPLAQGKKGVTYTVEVSHAGYPTVRGTCTVPGFDPSNIRLEYFANKGGVDVDSARRVRLFWENPSGAVSYFRFGAEAITMTVGNYEVVWPDYNLKTDQNQQQVESNFGSIFAYDFSGGTNFTSLGLDVSVKAMDEHLYRYMTTFDRHLFSQDNPFAEPVIMYSNIEGGLGIVGGYTESTYYKQIY